MKSKETRYEPYDIEAIPKEKLRRFWMGKTSRVRDATMTYLQKYGTIEQVTLDELVKKHGVTHTPTPTPPAA